MFTSIVETAAKYLIEESIRDEAIGDVWEADYYLKQVGSSKFYRVLVFIWRFLLLVKASIAIYIEESISDPDECDGLICTFDNESPPPLKAVDDDKTEVLKTYCNLRKHYNAQVSTRLIGCTDAETISLVEKMEGIREKNTTVDSQTEINAEFLVAQLKLGLLARNIQNKEPEELDCNYFRDLLVNMHLPKEFLMQYANFSQEKFIRTLVFRTYAQALITVYVIGWEPGQIALMHHHGQSIDGIIVVDGEMTHAQVAADSSVPFEGVQLIEKYEGPVNLFSEGEVVIIPPFYGHQIENASDKRLVTAHVRVGYVPYDEYWRPEQDNPIIVWNKSKDETTVHPFNRNIRC